MPRTKSRNLNNQYFIDAPPKRVFKWISRPERLKQWLADYAEISPRKGGRFALGWTDGPRHTGKLLEFVKGKRVTFGWTWDGIDLPPTRFSLSVAAKGKGTLLTVEHKGIPTGAKWVELYAGAVWGWTYFAMNLKSVLESGHDLRSRWDG
jgi:uncharacterized protein YndB with AHSA1/START domain